jgi:hypothetical protein
MRYTPITRPFKWAAELSSRIVRQDKVTTTPRPGRIQGLVLDLEGVWSDAVLMWAREARQDLRVDTSTPGEIVLRDRRGVRATLTVVSGAEPSGAPLVTVSGIGGAQRELALPVDAGAAADVVRAVVAEA